MISIPNTIEPTQVRYPWRATIRTIMQNIGGVILGIFGFVQVLSVVAPSFVEAVRELLPPEWYAWALGAVAFIALLAGAITRIMAIPGFNDLLTKIGLGAKPSA